MFFYKIHFFDEEKPGIQIDSGLVSADSYGEAADKVVDFYGEKQFASFERLYLCEDVIVSEELKEMLK